MSKYLLSSLTGGWIMDGFGMNTSENWRMDQNFLCGCRSQDRRLSFLFNYD